MQKYFKIGEISRLYHIGVDSLRYYEKIGLIHPVRSESGYRLYSDHEIWRLNVIRDLRELGFGTEAIGKYLDFQNVDTALEMLAQEQKAITEKMQALQDLQDNVQRRIENIRIARELPLDTITEKQCPDRRCFVTSHGYREDHEMDLLISQIQTRKEEGLNIIGNNQIGTILTHENGKIDYRSVFVIDDRGDKILPGGTYLTVCYRGPYRKSGPWLERLLACAEAHGWTPGDTALELLWIDIHTSLDEKEHITELQLPVSKA